VVSYFERELQALKNKTAKKKGPEKAEESKQLGILGPT
jgi:hypothetical protein